MAKSFKSLLGDDIKNTRTLLHEAIPITGTISSGTYSDNNIKTFSHGMFQSVYDYPYLSSSANHIFDVSFGITAQASSSAVTQAAKKRNIYNQMAQVLFGYDSNGKIRSFDSDGTLDDDAGRMDHCYFLNFSRLLCKDEIKKNSFRLGLFQSGSTAAPDTLVTLGDYDAGNEFRTSPAGDYGLIFSSSGDSSDNSKSVGLLFYQAGVAVVSSSVFQSPNAGHAPTPIHGDGTNATSIDDAQKSLTISQLANGFRHRLYDLDFNNTIELNSTIYFCRVNHNEFNYSANPTYVTASKLVVKNQATDLPITYITTVGLYSPDNELMAVAKLSEPIRKDPNTELTLRVRLDY
jgi:hypothetical protein